MVFAGSLRANSVSCAKQLRLSHSRALLASPRHFSTSLVTPARSSPLLSSPPPSEPENDAAESSSKSVKFDGADDESPAGSSAQSSSPPSSSSGGDSSDEVYPQVLALPIARRPLFPGFYKAVVVRNPAVDENTDSDVITDINSVHPITSVFAANSGTGDDKEEGLHCCFITELIKAGEHTSTAKVAGRDANGLPPPPTPTEGDVLFTTSFLHKHAISIVQVDNLVTQPYNKTTSTFVPLCPKLFSVLQGHRPANPLFRDQITNFSINQVASNVFDEPDKLADFAAAVSSEVLESLVVDDRLRKALLVLKKELINAQLQSKLSRDVDSKIAKRQREYYLMEQLKGIKRSSDKLIEKFKERAASLKMPEGANVTRNYLEWLTQVHILTYSITHAQTVLDEDHYGLKDVKDRILEFLAVGKLRGTVQGKIICLVGPPGVGKTSIGKSIARALNRQFFRFSVGGLTDVAEIKGHRRTYVGALPGKIIQALKRVGTEKSVDKIGRGINGDPASALLEIMDVPVDLSRVLFVCTANNLDTIPAPLLDRMEVLEVSGYVSEEKCVIAEKYLGPQAKEASGLKNADIVLEPSTVDCVRNLKKHIDKIYRKAALKLILDLGETVFPEPVPATATSTPAPSSAADPQPKTVEEPEDYVGPPVYHKDRMYVSPPPPGVSTGLGYLGNGSGAVMPVEATSMPGKGGLQLTGKLGEVIRESAQIGLSWVKAHAYELGITKTPEEQFLTDRDIHVHMPEGSIGKEGPSAGTAILSAFVSLFTKTKIHPDIAMTGEISLVGQVLPVGGLKEKILAAHRAGIKTILAPAANRADIEENVPESVKTGIRFVYVEDVREVLHEVFRGQDIVERWKDTLSL
ncbi:Lon protease C-terminal proteolytic domain-containing protein [Suillus subalutaceus]|uniref:Lon protease C-terminal proteolytic domain-containing protein n=1 Tax=Suillus subalutaceus TaxID=48586 RepID=UPI001B86D63D|nr:Lon protease C-terminal proteolytic domain-containing protein [Suillus subalutaceus]KAG1843336.1 Lon protease C-terminal proteolytic domain-containing protein [Suillus subalutaceus]